MVSHRTQEHRSATAAATASQIHALAMVPHINPQISSMTPTSTRLAGGMCHASDRFQLLSDRGRYRSPYKVSCSACSAPLRLQKDSGAGETSVSDKQVRTRV